MPKIITNNFRSHIAKQFIESFDEGANTIYYAFAAKSTPFENDNQPTSNNSVYATYYQLYDELIFGKHVTPTDIIHMINDRQWVSGTVYDHYDDKIENLKDKNFYVVSPESGNYHVFKCLNNNNGAASTDQPLRSETAPNDEYYQTVDGYEWKFMFTVTAAQYNKFAANGYLPVVEDVNVQANAVPGAIETYIVEDGGTSYNSYANGMLKEVSVAGNNLIHAIHSETFILSGNTDFYKGSAFYIRSGTGSGQLRKISEYIVTGSEKRVLLNKEFVTKPDFSSSFEILPYVNIEGDGRDAEAISVVNTVANSVYAIEVVNRGTDYSYANVTIVGNTGTVNGGVSSAIARAIISPKGGHGSDPINELFSSRVGLSVVFDGDEVGTVPASNDYRQIGILKEPRFANAELTISTSATNFADGETVLQANTGATAEVSNRDGTTLRLRDIRGFFKTGNSTVNYITGQTSNTVAEVTAIDRGFETFDQRTYFTVEVTYNGSQGTGFSVDEKVIQAETNSEGYVHSISNNVIYLTNVKGNFAVSDDVKGTVKSFVGQTTGAVAKINGKVEPDLMDGSGEFLYIESMQPVVRSASQKETVKLIIEF